MTKPQTPRDSAIATSAPVEKTAKSQLDSCASWIKEFTSNITTVFLLNLIK